MKTILLLQFLVVSMYVTSQCSPTHLPTDIYYSNSSTTPTNVSGYEYLCGPNTIVYDTINSGCHFIYVNAGSNLVFKYGACATASIIWLKNNSSLTLLQGTNPIQIIHEPLAIINNTSGVIVSSFSCTAITFPIVNCTPTSLNEIKTERDIFQIYPNPANTVLNIVQNNSEMPSKVEIVNCLGQIVREELFIRNNSIDITTTDLPNGMYTVNLVYQTHRSSKRFVIAK